MTRRRRALALQAAGLAALTAGLWLAEWGPLAPPPLWHPAGLGAWWSSRGPIVSVFAMLRTALACWGTYLMVLWAVAVSGGPSAAPRVLRLPGGRFAAAVIASTATVVSAPGVAWAGESSPAPPTMTYLGPVGATVPAPATGEPKQVQVTRPVPAASPPRVRKLGRRVAPGRPVPHQVPAAPEPDQVPPMPDPVRVPATSNPDQVPPMPDPVPPMPDPVRTQLAPVAPPPPPPPELSHQWTVRPGDDLWTIAATVLGPGHDVAGIAAYWERVVAVNVPFLPDPDNPDLIFPGDVIRLPPAPT